MSPRPSLALALAILLAGCGQKEGPGDPAPSAASPFGAHGPQEERLIRPADVSAPLVEPPRLLSDEQLSNGWIALFDGQTLFGWSANSEADWAVRDGAIVSRGGPPGLLLTTTRWRDYKLHCEVWLEPGGNSGIFLRSVTHPAGPMEGCIEFNLADRHETFPTGSLVGRANANETSQIEGDWHAVELTVQGERISARIDGRMVLDAASPEFLETGGGHIGLQQNGGEVRFRNIFVCPLGGEPLIAETSLAGWREVPGSEIETTIDEGVLRLRGTGYLETEETFGDFVLQFEARLNGRDVNSGLFFRAERGTVEAPANGYELQLQNTLTDGDRTRPADYGDGFGTGAIFRRQAARYVNANDEEWFSVTLVADGNRFASWVNGLQVTDFVDERAPDSNPRRGRRDEPGHLSLQGHDANTDVSVRQMRIILLDL